MVAEGALRVQQQGHPIRMLIDRYGHEHRVRDAIARMRHQACRQQPRFSGVTDQIGDPRYCRGKRVAEISR